MGWLFLLNLTQNPRFPAIYYNVPYKILIFMCILTLRAQKVLL